MNHRQKRIAKAIQVFSERNDPVDPSDPKVQRQHDLLAEFLFLFLDISGYPSSVVLSSLSRVMFTVYNGSDYEFTEQEIRRMMTHINNGFVDAAMDPSEHQFEEDIETSE